MSVTDGTRRSPLAELSLIPLRSVILLGLSGSAKALALIGMATAVATGITSVLDGGSDWRGALWLGVSSVLLRGAVAWAQRVIATRALLTTKEDLRASLADRLLQRGDARVGADTSLATRGLDELDSYITVFLPSLITAACVPLLVGARILFADWVSALVIVLTVPLIPVFMALIGLHTQERVAAAAASLERLSEHVVELARGLPVLLGLGRAAEQARALRRISEEFRGRTMQTLRTAFLSSLALELIATISVAIVAVFIGFRLVNGSLPLEVGLLALLLAPECFTPFREVGSAFHAAQDGKEALSRVRAVVSAETDASSASVADRVVARGLRVRYAGRDNDSIGPLSFAAPEGLVTVLDGPSGSGKTTVLRLLAGRLSRGVARVDGELTVLPAEQIAWLPQRPRTLERTVADELAVYADGVPRASMRIHEVLSLVRIEHLEHADPARLSPGELRRVGVARVLLRVDAGARLVLLDEPSAHLDADSARAVIAAIASLRGRATVIVASHDPEVRALGDLTVPLGDTASPGKPEGLRPSSELEGVAPLPADRDDTDDGTALPELLRFFRPVAARVALALLLGTLATLFAISLTAVSAWLIVKASEQPHIMTLLVAIVGVRFFGIGRAVLRYSERLVGHDAAFGALTHLRMRLWSGLAARGLGSRASLTSGNTLDRLVRDADVVRDLALRAVLPPLVGVITVAVAVGALVTLHPPTLPLLITWGVAVLVLAPTVALIADRAAARAEHELRSTVLQRFAALLGAADDLVANGVDHVARATLRTADAAASTAARRGAASLGLGEAIVIVACGLTALAMLPLATRAVTLGELDGAVLAVLTLVPLSLIEPALDFVAGVRQWPTLRRVLRRVGALTRDGDGAAPAQTPSERPVTMLNLDTVAAHWPGAAREAFTGISATVSTGQWLVVSGPSGTGKSTLLSLLLGHLAPSAGRYTLNSADAASQGLLRRIAWCPQEGHLFDSTIRANLLIARPRDDAPSDSEMREVLERVGLGRLLATLPLGLDTRIGSDGHALSGGERQRVAVARTLLARADVVLLDEPTAHLDAQADAALLRDLRAALHDRIVVLVTHDPDHRRPEDVSIRLGQRPEAARALNTAAMSVALPRLGG